MVLLLDETEVQVHQILYLEVLLLTVEVDEVLSLLVVLLVLVQMVDEMHQKQLIDFLVPLIDDEVVDDVPMQQQWYDELDELELW